MKPENEKINKLRVYKSIFLPEQCGRHLLSFTNYYFSYFLIFFFFSLIYVPLSGRHGWVEKDSKLKIFFIIKSIISLYD
ncbi:hypothetical protein Lalb_Chr08g0239841 [Lupinus albus]|uniref:Uncharacterized protein n=1 Tax=Lupinus albus TaxID=3870 RepID=A0A6A4Q544_LUPAL|nr:hypothetical protein Lalb_Chr08g0239841 [Lupinus albus]